jgi:hypothetical protein
MESPFEWINQKEEVSTGAMQHGSLVDCLLFTPDCYETLYSIVPETYPAKGSRKDDPPIDKPWTTKATYCQEWEDGVRAQGKTPIKSVDLNTANCAIRRLNERPVIRELLESSDFQVCVSADWHDEVTGLVVPIKCLIDIVPHGKSFLADLKTARSLNRRDYNRSFFDNGYASQCALYLDAYNIATNESRNEFRHIISKNSSPFECAARYVSDEFIQIGRTFYRHALALYCQCLGNNNWPGIDEFQPSREAIGGWDVIQPEAWMMWASL